MGLLTWTWVCRSGWAWVYWSGHRSAEVDMGLLKWTLVCWSGHWSGKVDIGLVKWTLVCQSGHGSAEVDIDNDRRHGVSSPYNQQTLEEPPIILSPDLHKSPPVTPLCGWPTYPAWEEGRGREAKGGRRWGRRAELNKKITETGPGSNDPCIFYRVKERKRKWKEVDISKCSKAGGIISQRQERVDDIEIEEFERMIRIERNGTRPWRCVLMYSRRSDLWNETLQ